MKLINSLFVFIFSFSVFATFIDVSEYGFMTLEYYDLADSAQLISNNKPKDGGGQTGDGASKVKPEDQPQTAQEEEEEEEVEEGLIFSDPFSTHFFGPNQRKTQPIIREFSEGQSGDGFYTEIEPERQGVGSGQSGDGVPYYTNGDGYTNLRKGLETFHNNIKPIKGVRTLNKMAKVVGLIPNSSEDDDVINELYHTIDLKSMSNSFVFDESVDYKSIYDIEDNTILVNEKSLTKILEYSRSCGGAFMDMLYLKMTLDYYDFAYDRDALMSLMNRFIKYRCKNGMELYI